MNVDTGTGFERFAMDVEEDCTTSAFTACIIDIALGKRHEKSGFDTDAEAWDWIVAVTSRISLEA